MDPSIMKLLEEDEDETMHSGVDLEAFTAALNRDIEGDSSTSYPSKSDSVRLSQGGSYTLNQFAPWQTSSHDENATHQSLRHSQNMQQKEGNSSYIELKQHGTNAPNREQENDSSQELNSLPLQHAKDTYQQLQSEQDTLNRSGVFNLQSSDKNPESFESQHLNLKGTSSQQSMQSFATGTSTQQLMAAETSNQPEFASGLRSQPAINVTEEGNVPLAMLFPHIEPQLDKDRATQLQTVYLKLRKNEISKEGFIRHMKSIIGDQMLKMAVYKFQSQAARNTRTVPQSQASPQQHLQKRTDDSSNLAADSNAKKLHEVENQADLHGTPGSHNSSSSLITVKQESDCSAFPVQGLDKQQQQHLHFSQASFPKFANIGNDYSPCSVTNVSSSMARPLKQQSNDLKMRQIRAHPNRNAAELGASTQSMNMISAPKLERQNSFGESKRIPGGSLSHVSSTSIMQQSSVQWPRSTNNKEQRSVLLTPMTNLRPKPMDHLHDQQHKSQLAPFFLVPVEQKSSSSESSKDETFEVQTSRMGISTTASNKHSNLLSFSVASQMDTITLLNSRTPSVTSSIGPGNNGKIPLKKPTMGQKKPLDTKGFSPPPSGKKQKVSGAFSDQSIEQLNDVAAVSGVILREEEEQLFSGPRENSRVSESSQRAVQEEEEKLILQKNPLQRKLNGIMAKCGLKNMSSDVERCISLSVEDRMRGLISSLNRISKQRVDIEKSRHRTVVTSDVRRQIMALNHKVREEWEKQAEAEKLQKANELEGIIGDDDDKEKDEGHIKSVKANKEVDDKMRTTAANVAARAAVGGDDMLSKWQLMAEQARQKREGELDVASRSKHGKDVHWKSLSTPTRNPRDHQEAEKRSQSTSPFTPGALRRVGRNQVTCCITVKDVIAVLEREPQMSKSRVIYRLHEKIRSDAPVELS